MLNMKKYIGSAIVLLFLSTKILADEGMWLPQLLQSLNEKEMKKMGMKISAADIYNINKASLKDAIVSFGGFCTAEVISDKGLLLTNHHCGFDAIQNHSSVKNNYIADGFWAYNKDQELQNPGLFATFIIRIDDVTKTVLQNIHSNLSEKERQSIIDKNIDALKTAVKKETYQDVIVKSFFDGLKYFLFITETYKDIRLVGAPPSSIGNFGKDTDNWMWPRHTGDFSMFRIYADKDNKPAEYSATNVPYKPKRALNISLDGLKERDFTMVFGFPGRTNEYLHSAAVKQIMEVNDPLKISIREKALQILDSFMRNDAQIKIQYAAKYAGIENAYKKWKGEVLGLKTKDAVGKKKIVEGVFEKIVLSRPEMNVAYLNLLKELEAAYAAIEPYTYARDYYNEVVGKIELFTIAAQVGNFNRATTQDKISYKEASETLSQKITLLFAEYNVKVDKKLFEVLMEMYVKNQPEKNVSPLLKNLLLTHNNSYEAVANYIYDSSAFTSLQKINSLIVDGDTTTSKQIINDVAMKLFTDIVSTYSKDISKKLNELQSNINELQRNYMQAQMDVFADKKFYPDANNTLRVTYGNVKGYSPNANLKYDFYTYLDGAIKKYKPADYEFDLPQKLIDLYNKKDFGRYGVNGKQPVCFIASNHTTGGNSGSPALDANGNLVGLNFDRVWEGTMSDINYDASICRNIMVDIRYVLFIIDKFAGAKNIINELKIVKKNKK
jgi:Peptidase S46